MGKVEGHGGLWELRCHQRPRNQQERREPGRSQSIPNKSMETRTKKKSKQRNILGSGLPLLGEGNFHCGGGPGRAEVMTSGF